MLDNRLKLLCRLIEKKKSIWACEICIFLNTWTRIILFFWTRIDYIYFVLDLLWGIMPCSAVSVDYHRESPAMPVPLSRSILDSDFSRIKYNSLNSCTSRRTSSSSTPIGELVAKYSTSRWEFRHLSICKYLKKCKLMNKYL